MEFMIRWSDGAQIFPTYDEAVAAARHMDGTVLVHAMPAGSVSVFREGQELEGAEASEATNVFMSEAPACEQLGCTEKGVDQVLDLSSSPEHIVHLCQEHADALLSKQHSDGLHRSALENCQFCRGEGQARD